MKQQLSPVTQKQINRAFKPTFIQKVKTGAGIIVLGTASWLFYHSLLPSQAFGQDKKANSAQGAQQDSSKIVIAKKSITDSIAQRANAMLAQRGLSLRVGGYVSSFRMPAVDGGFEVFDGKGERLIHFSGDETARLREYNFKCPIGSYVYIYFGGAYGHAFEKANAP